MPTTTAAPPVGANTGSPGGHPSDFLATSRSDRWWVGPLLTIVGLGAFVVYTTWRALQGTDYWADPYLSPFYSPLLFANPELWEGSPVAHAWLGTWPSWWPAFLPASPALFILVFPGAFRATCYYYRKAYYRSFFATPPGCAVCPRSSRPYHGETRLLIIQNLHRYALYAAVAFVVILTYDAFCALFREVNGERRFGIGVGTGVLFVNAFLLAAYTFGCHSWRHLIAGRLNRFSGPRGPGLAYHAWKRISWLNARHMLFAWLSLFWVGFTDFYIVMVATGRITDWNTWGEG